jgi:hypothetical protein
MLQEHRMIENSIRKYEYLNENESPKITTAY